MASIIAFTLRIASICSWLALIVTVVSDKTGDSKSLELCPVPNNSSDVTVNCLETFLLIVASAVAG